MLFVFAVSPRVIAQNASGDITFVGYLETYYSYDFGSPNNHERPDFLYNFRRHNEFSVNLALLGAKYHGDSYRGTITLMSGSYPQYYLVNEPTWVQFIHEASAGVKLREDLWLDVGIMPSHFSFESPVGIGSWHLSRSVLAENSPYFFTGARITYEPSTDLELALWLANGWRNVQRHDRNQSMAFGVALRYRPDERLEFNYANYLGNEYPQPLKLYRFFNSFHVQWKSGSVGLALRMDHGMEQKLFTQTFNRWYGATASVKKDIGDKVQAAIRGEYYSDIAGVVLDQGMRMSGLSANLDFKFSDRAMLRLEGRQFISPFPVFNKPDGLMNKGNTAISTSLAIKFHE